MAQETASFMTGGKEAQTSGPSGGKDDGGPLNSLNQAIGSDGPLFYPVDIQTIDHYMIFSAYKEHTFQGLFRSNQDSIVGPMPYRFRAIARRFVRPWSLLQVQTQGHRYHRFGWTMKGLGAMMLHNRRIGCVDNRGPLMRRSQIQRLQPQPRNRH